MQGNMTFNNTMIRE